MNAEILIAGAGPTGVSAALWARSLDLRVRLIEANEKTGGQLHDIHFHPTQLPGIPSGEGPDIARNFRAQLDAVGVTVEHEMAVEALLQDGNGGDPRVRIVGGEEIVASALLIATGVRRRRLGVPGESELEGSGVSYSARRDGSRFAGKNVVVVGGGDGAFENALILKDLGCQVTIVTRNAPRARSEFRDRVAAASIEQLESTRVVAFVGRPELEAIRFESGVRMFDRPAQGAVIKVGVVPNTEWCRAALSHDDEGFLLVSQHYRASRPQVWAAGDVIRPALFGIPVAIGAAALAIADIRATLRSE